MRTLSVLVVSAVVTLVLAGKGSGQPSLEANEKHDMLRMYLSVRHVNGRPAVPALVVLCPAVTGVPLDSTFAATRAKWEERETIMAGECGRIPYTVDSLSLRGQRQVIKIDSLSVAENRATLSATVYRSGGTHSEKAYFSRDTGWGLDSLTFTRFVEF